MGRHSYPTSFPWKRALFLFLVVGVPGIWVCRVEHRASEESRQEWIDRTRLVEHRNAVVLAQYLRMREALDTGPPPRTYGDVLDRIGPPTHECSRSNRSPFPYTASWLLRGPIPEGDDRALMAPGDKGAGGSFRVFLTGSCDRGAPVTGLDRPSEDRLLDELPAAPGRRPPPRPAVPPFRK